MFTKIRTRNFQKSVYRFISETKTCEDYGQKEQTHPSTLTKVTVLNAGNLLGQALALLLKQSPLVDVLCLYEDHNLSSMTKDLSYIDTNSVVISYEGRKNLFRALRESHVVVALSSTINTLVPSRNLVESQAPTIRDFARHISQHCPTAFVAWAVDPINSTFPLFCEFYQKAGNFNPRILFGVATLAQMRANKFVAETLGIDPVQVHVPVIGGTTDSTMLPLFSMAKPNNTFSNSELLDLANTLRSSDKTIAALDPTGEAAVMSKATAIFRFVSSLLKALHHVTNIVEIAFIKMSDCRLRYFAVPLQLGPGGIIKNLGIPKLNEFEQTMYEDVSGTILEEVKIGESLAGKPKICEECSPAPRCDIDQLNMKN